MTATYNNQLSYGGFSPDKLRDAIIEECLLFGDLVNYFYVLLDVVTDLEDELMETGESGDTLWSRLAKEYSAPQMPTVQDGER